MCSEEKKVQPGRKKRALGGPGRHERPVSPVMTMHLAGSTWLLGLVTFPPLPGGRCACPRENLKVQKLCLGQHLPSIIKFKHHDVHSPGISATVLKS